MLTVVVVNLQVSKPYKRSDLTLELKSWIFVLFLRIFELRMFLSRRKTALVLWILTDICICVSFFVNAVSQVGKGVHLFEVISIE